MYKGTMIPDWAPVQKGDGRIVYINLQSGQKIEEDPRAAYERYQHALKDGYVSAYLIKVLIVGAAGVGKTHLLHLLFNKEPPKERKSTPLMERPVQTILTALKDSTAFKEVTDQDLYELIGHSVNERVNQTANFPNSQQYADMSMCSSVNKSVLVAEKNMEKEAGKDSEITPISEVEENLVIPISKYKNVARLHDIDWIYFIDSGGQPQFHQLLPAFLLHTNLNIFVLRLCDKLDNCPNEEYYEEKIGCISSAISVRSNKEILQSCAQATQTKDTTANSRLIIVGTHRDQEHLCANETQQDKSKLLRELLLPSMENYIMMNSSSAAKSDIMFSLNTKNPDSSDIKIAEELRNTILSMKTRIEPQKIPLKWLMFHQELQALSKKLNTDQLDFEQCALVAKRLHLQGDTATALMFFSKLNVIMYYPEVLPDVIFINSQSLLNIVTLLIKYVLYDNNHKLINDHIVRAARSEGIISIELLKLMRSDVPHVYKPTMIKLLNLLSYLGIVCKSDKGYFMPSLLKGLDVKHIESLLSKHPDSVAPCAVYHENRWLDCGAFGFLITSLLSLKTWKIAFDGPDLPCVHSNLIKMYYDSSIVTFVDYVSHTELHVHAKDVHTCQDICPEILWSVFNAFNEVKPLFTFICPCTNFERHIAKFSSNSLKRKEIFCSREQTNKFELSSLGDEPLVWILKAVSVLKINMDKIIHEIQNPDKLTDLLCSSNIISCDLQDKVHTSSDIKNKNRIMLDAVCAHLSSKPQEYAVFRKYALQMHPSLKRFLPSEYCLSCIPLDDELDAPAPKRPKKEIQEEDLKYPGFCEPYFTENCAWSCVSLDEKCDVPAPKRQIKANQDEEQGNNKSPGLGVDTGNSVILQCNDHLKIFQVSKAASKKWKAIGRELGFKQDELDSIPCEAGNTSMEDYYAAMLSRWLKWAPPCHPFPSVQLLSQALCNNGEEKRAFDLCKVFNVYRP